jgi:hypothetical protein
VVADDYVITRIDWLLGRRGTPAKDALIRRFFALVSFLQKQGLTTREIVSDISEVTEESELRSTDLTGEGLALLGRSYKRWAANMDISHDYDDTSILQRELARMRSSSS